MRPPVNGPQVSDGISLLDSIRSGQWLYYLGTHLGGTPIQAALRSRREDEHAHFTIIYAVTFASLRVLCLNFARPLTNQTETLYYRPVPQGHL